MQIERTRREASENPHAVGLRRARYSALRLGAGIWGFALWLLCAQAVGAAGLGTRPVSGSGPEARRPAVAAANLRLGARYDYGFIDQTEATDASPGSSSTLELDDVQTHAGSGEILGTLPLSHSTGLRGRFHVGYEDQARDPAAGSPDTQTLGYGASLDVFLRDPDLGSLTLGGDYTRLDGDDDYEANAYTGHGQLQIFFPDLGAGPVDWFLDVAYTHRDDAGTSRPFRAEEEALRVEGGAGWYLSDDLQLVLGGRWTQAEGADADLEERVGFAAVRWLLPLLSTRANAGRLAGTHGRRSVSIEVDLGGYVGHSEYQEDPFRSDGRFAYGASAGVTLRFGSGVTLLEALRAYD